MTETVRPTFLNLPEDKQARIIEAALTEFADKGYQQASLNTIVAASGIAKGSLYQYFTDKSGIFLYVFDFAIAVVRRLLVQVKETTLEEDFFTRLERSLLAGLDFIRQHPQIYGLYLKILFDQQVPQRQELLRRVRQYAADYLHSLLRQGLARGELRPDLPVASAVFLLDALLDRFLQAAGVPALDVVLDLAQADAATIQARVREVLALLRHGLGAPPRQA
ncbi:MAG: TetR/AcrR family transcriptional regulator [Desulfobacca sp.]|uniref:TetR/AcrR family transcriptional regulator n=1 Tax=Desulfobacca sp. TaxID=2067990 RepID=UPI00404948D2